MTEQTYPKRPKIADDITKLIGNTPLVRLNKFAADAPAHVVAKLECFNPLASVKDRIAVAMIEAAEQSGELNAESVIIEPTSGNTGIGLAWVAAVKGYRLILCMPDTMSIERRKLLAGLGAELVLTPGAEGMKGAINQVDQLLQEHENAITLGQFSNPANPKIHEQTTAMEIWEDTDHKVDIVVAGVGTGGTISGVGKRLKQLKPDIKMVAVEPQESAVLTGRDPGKHKIQGIGAGFIPDIYNSEFVDEVLTVSSEESGLSTRRLAREEGIMVGISSGAALTGAMRVAARPENKDKIIVVILPDTGERYLSTWLFEIS